MPSWTGVPQTGATSPGTTDRCWRGGKVESEESAGFPVPAIQTVRKRTSQNPHGCLILGDLSTLPDHGRNPVEMTPGLRLPQEPTYVTSSDNFGHTVIAASVLTLSGRVET